MKSSVILSAVGLTLLFACSAKSGDDNGNSGTGASSNVGATSNSGGTPNLGSLGGSGGGVVIGPTGGTPEQVVDNGECAQQNFVLASKPADVLLVLDRSKSMIENMVPPMNLTRWDAVVPALTAVIRATDSSVSWGLKVFPEGEGAACVASGVTSDIPVKIAPLNAGVVNAAIMGTSALGNGTPTGDAIVQATAYLTSRGASNQYIVLATDGDPSCPDDDDAAEAHAIEALAAAKTAGFPTYVIGVLDPVKDKSKFPVLNAMAEAGGTSRTDNPIGDKFYQANSEAELTAALQAVTGQVASCVFEFDKKPPDETNIAVKVNGALVMQDKSKAEGWDYTSDQYMGLELHGEACKQVKDATDNKVDIIFGCKGKPIK
jgi:von Willebrand factor type A domain